MVYFVRYILSGISCTVYFVQYILSGMFCPSTFCLVYFVKYVLSGYVLSGIFCPGIFCPGIFCLGIFCPDLFCPGIFYPSIENERLHLSGQTAGESQHISQQAYLNLFNSKHTWLRRVVESIETYGWFLLEEILVERFSTVTNHVKQHFELSSSISTCPF